MNLRKFAKSFALLLIVLLVLLPGAAMAQDDPAATAVETAEFVTNTPAVTATEVQATDDPTPAETPEVIVITVEVTPLPTPVPIFGGIDEQLPGYDSDFVQALIDSALTNYRDQSLAFIVVIALIAVAALILLYRSVPPETAKKLRSDALTGLGKLEDAVDVKIETAQKTIRPDDDVFYNALKLLIVEAAGRLEKIEPPPSTNL